MFCLTGFIVAPVIVLRISIEAGDMKKVNIKKMEGDVNCYSGTFAYILRFDQELRYEIWRNDKVL